MEGNMEWLVVLLVLATLFGGLGLWVAVQKNREPFEGFMLGFLFGPVGAIIEALMPTIARPARETRYISEYERKYGGLTPDEVREAQAEEQAQRFLKGLK